MLNVSEVFVIMGRTLGIAVALDWAAGYFMHIAIPWYATTAVLTLFMYACESSQNAALRRDIDDNFKKVGSNASQTMDRLDVVEAEAADGRKLDPLWEDVKELWNEVGKIREEISRK